MSDSCPICGNDTKNYHQHRCSKKSLDAIDASRKRDHNNSENKKPFWIRLQHGFEAMRLSDDSLEAKSDED